MGELPGIAQDLHGPIENPVEPRTHGRAKIVEEWFNLSRERREDQTFVGIDLEFLE